MTEYIKREDAIDAVLDVYYNTPDIDLSGERLEAAILKVQPTYIAHLEDCVELPMRTVRLLMFMSWTLMMWFRFSPRLCMGDGYLEKIYLIALEA